MPPGDAGDGPDLDDENPPQTEDSDAGDGPHSEEGSDDA